MHPPFVKKQRVFSAPEGHASKKNGFFLRRRVASPKKTDFFCTGGSRVKKNGFFLRPRVTRQKIMDFFCAAGLQVQKKRIFSAPQGCKSKNNGFFLRRRVACQKTMAVFCAAGLQVKKRRLRQHKMLHLNKKTAKKLVHKHFFSTFEALINRRVSNTALTQQAIEKDELRDNPICKLFGSRVHNATTLTGTRPAGGVTLEKITTLNVQKRDA